MKIVETLPDWILNTNQYDFRIQFFSNESRIPELLEWLDNSTSVYRMEHFDKNAQDEYIKKINSRNILATVEDGNTFVSFDSENDMMRFKLSWVECEDARNNLYKVVLPIIRRVMPKIIAHDIIGVQPMTGPVSQIMALRAKYNTPAPIRSKIKDDLAEQDSYEEDDGYESY